MFVHRWNSIDLSLNWRHGWTKINACLPLYNTYSLSNLAKHHKQTNKPNKFLRNTTLFHQWPPHSATKPANKPANRKTSTPRLVRRFLVSSKDTIATPMRSHTPPNAPPKPKCFPIQATQPPKLKHNAVAPKHRPTIRGGTRKVWCRISRIVSQNTMVAAVVAVTVRVTMKTAASGRQVTFTQCIYIYIVMHSVNLISDTCRTEVEYHRGSMCVIIEES